MRPFFILLLALQLFNTTTFSKILNAPLDKVNSIYDKLSDYSLFLPPVFSNENDELLDDEDFLPDITDIRNEDIPLIQTFRDKTELKFRQPIESVNIDYSRNAVVLKFHRNNAKPVMRLDSIENEKKKSLQDNFLRFGKRSFEEFPATNSLADDFSDKNYGKRLERRHENARDARGDNFMRFGRSGNVKNDFMRFGRGSNDMRFGLSPSEDLMRFSRFARSDNSMRLGRSAGQDFMRFGRTPSQDFMRFGRTPSQDFMRFGRAGQDDFMRFGRNPHDNLMKLGHNKFKIPVNTNFMRYSRPDNFMRFGRAPPPQPSDNFMRFGKSMDKSNERNTSQPLLDKNELKQAVKLIHESDKNDDNENPVDKAIKVLFDKHQQRYTNEKAHSDEINDESSHQRDDSNSLDNDMDYFTKMSK